MAHYEKGSVHALKEVDAACVLFFAVSFPRGSRD